LFKLYDLIAPNLANLDLSNNNFDQYDFVDFMKKFPFEKLPNLEIMKTNLILSENNLKKISFLDKIRAKSKLKLDFENQRLKRVNKAQI
jgi:hypothetical protein